VPVLYSATQTISIKALARLYLNDPEYVSVLPAPPAAEPTSAKKKKTMIKNKGEDSDDGAADYDDVVYDDKRGANIVIVVTPQGLTQPYTVITPQDKLSALWSFIKTRIHSKIFVFFATGKQLRFAYDSLCKLRPGIPILHILGNMKQPGRADMYDFF
jgi:superfamily II DNA/RNA helicase